MKPAITGSQAFSWGVQLARAEVVAACPAMPQAVLLESLSERCAAGELKARLVRAESDASALAASIGASFAGARTFAATSAPGLALMHELLIRAAAARLPIVMASVPGASVRGRVAWTEPDRGLAQRDTGWIQIHCESGQEALDSTIQAFKLAENVQLPVMVVLDAVPAASAKGPVVVPEPADVDAFLPGRRAGPPGAKDADGLRPLVPPAPGTEERHRHQQAMAEALATLAAVDEDWGRRFGRRYGAVESYQAEGADLVLVVSGTVASAAREVVDELRARGEQVGLVKVRLFRPFPAAALRTALAGTPQVVVLDRDFSPGHGGILAGETRAALYDADGAHRPSVQGCLVGPGGRDAGRAAVLECIERARTAAKRPAAGEREDIWVGVQS